MLPGLAQVAWSSSYHLFLKRPFLPRSARVRRFSRYEVSPHIPEHYPFRVQTQLIHIILYTFSPCLPCPYPHISPLPPPHFYRLTPNHLHSYVPHVQTTSIYHASPSQPRCEPQKTVQIHTALPILQQHPAHPSHHHPFRPLQTLLVEDMKSIER